MSGMTPASFWLKAKTPHNSIYLGRKSTIHEKASQVLYLFVIYPQITWSNIFLRKNDMGNNSSIPFPICGSFVYPNLTQFIQFIHDITKNANIYIYTDNDRQCLI